jgi:hypothetical protein
MNFLFFSGLFETFFLLLFVVSDCKRCRTRGRCATFSGLIRTIGNVKTCVWYTTGMRSYRRSQRMVCDFASPILFAHKDRIQIFCQFRILVFFFIVVANQCCGFASGSASFWVAGHGSGSASTSKWKAGSGSAFASK